MKNVSIKYNPYLVTTVITIDGQKPKPNSSLNVGNVRLQEWVDMLPEYLKSDYRDSNFKILFTGTQSDFEDVKTSFDSFKNEMNVTFEHNKTADVADVEMAIHQIFVDIQNGPIKELKDKGITEAFNKAKNSLFEINVVATMSSGKSTLINALLGKLLMPAANEATTATIVKIIDTDQEDFSAIAFDKSGNKVEEIASVSLEDMKSLNRNPAVTVVELRGKIPFVTTTGMKLVLVDTPGPNNSRDKNHEEMTYRMLRDSDKSLVLYVMNGGQLGINDEKTFLNYICDVMKEGGKQARERFIFAVNKMDGFSPSPKKDGAGCIERALKGVKEGLEERGIINPNIFPVSSLSALEYRTEDEEPQALLQYQNGLMRYKELQFDDYYHYSHLPQTVHHRIDEILEGLDNYERVEIHSGICSIEQAISLYINKYARTTKVCDLVQSFNNKLQEMSAVAKLEDAIRKDKNAKEQLEKLIEKITENINKAREAQTFSKKIDSMNLTHESANELKKYTEDIRNKVNRMMSGRSTRKTKEEARRECEQLEKECRSISAQVKVQIEQIMQKSYKKAINSIIDEYKSYLSQLNVGIDNVALTLNPLSLASTALANLTYIIENNTERADESYYVKEEYQKRVEGGILRKTASFLTFGIVDDYTYETAYRNKRIAKYVDYVDMNEVASEYLTPFINNLRRVHDSAISYVENETLRLKNYLKKELVKIDRLIDEKLDSLSKTKEDSKAMTAEIAQKEANLKWLENIQKRVNEIVEF